MHFSFMNPRRRWLGALFLGLAIACRTEPLAGPERLPPCVVGHPITLAVGGYASIDPDSVFSCVTFAANASTTDTAEYLLIPQSAGGVPGASASFHLARSLVGPAGGARLPVEALSLGAGGSSALRFHGFLRALGHGDRAPVLPVAGGAAAPAPLPPVAAGPPVVGSLRTFKICGSLACFPTKDVTARVQSVGAHVAIYVDTLAAATGGALDSADVDTLTQLFDSRLYPLDTAAFGGVSDIDSNGVVLVLMTGAVNSLISTAECDTAGFIAGYFFPSDLHPSFASYFNHGEVFYTIIADSTGQLSCAHSRAGVKKLLPPVFLHELQHMISFGQHVLARGGAGEDIWLDEGLSKYAEELGGRSFLPGDTAAFEQYVIQDLYDAAQYLGDPGGHFLLAPSDQNLADIGAGWLFVRYLADQFGDSIARRLVQTSDVGTANIATRTGQPFALTVGRWALANWASDLPGFAAPPELRYVSWRYRAELAAWHTRYPTFFPAVFPLAPSSGGASQVDVAGTLRGGSGVYVRAFQAPGAGPFTLVLSDGGGGFAVADSIVPRLAVLRIR